MTNVSPSSPEPEFLQSGTPGAEPGEPGRSRRGKAIGLGVGAVLVVGAVAAGTWAASTLSGGGPGAAEVLPAGALAYASVDLDPSASQKVNAFKVMKKFPGLREELDLDSQDDLRKTLVEATLEDNDCDLSYAADFEPWLGNKLGVALLKGDPEPEPILALQSDDADKATTAVKHIVENCASEEKVGVTSLDGYVLVGSSQKAVDQALAAASKKSLAEDDAFNDHLDKIGGQGIATFYVAKAAVTEFTQAVKNGFEEFGGIATDDAGSALDELAGSFEGAAGTLRFSGDGVEFEAVVSSADKPGERTVLTGIGDLPESTVAAAGIRIGDQYLDQMADRLDESGIEAETGFEELFGISVVDTFRTLLGGELVLAVDGSTDFTGLDAGPEGIKAGLRINGDPDKISDTLDKLLDTMGMTPGEIVTEKSDDAVAIGYDSTYLRQLLAGGKLGASDGFTSAVPRADKAAGVLYLDADGSDDWLVELAKSAGETDRELLDNIAPLRTFGASTWSEGNDGHLLLKLTAD